MEAFLKKITAFFERDAQVESVIVVGSYARGTNTAESDLDLCILTANKAEMVAHPDFVQAFGDVREMQTEYYGACTSIRVWYEDGPEVEFGIVEPSWIDMPLDAGTRGVLRDGYRVLLDKKQRFQNLPL